MLAPALRSSTLTRDDELARALDARRSVAAAGRSRPGRAPRSAGRPTPSATRSPPGRLSTLWRLHGRLASARGDQSRAIALHGRALKQAEAAHDSRAIGLAHYELGQCYRQVGDIAIVREHITKAASALHAAGDRRHLALVHSLSGISLAQLGPLRRGDGARCGRPSGSRRSVQADDVLATVCGNQANVMMLQHRYEQALALAERSVALHEAHGSGHGLAVALATLGQICVRLGDLGARRRRAAPRARRPQPDPVPRDDRRRLRHARADPPDSRRATTRPANSSARASEAYGAYGRQTSQWYEWSVRVLGARLALRRGALDEARRARRRDPAGRRAAVRRAAGDAHRRRGADRRRTGSPKPSSACAAAADALDPKTSRRPPGASTCGCAARCTRKSGSAGRRVPRLRAERDAARSARRALSGRAQPSRARPPRRARPARARSPSAISTRRSAIFEQLGAERDLADTRARAAAAHRRSAPASTSSRPPTPTMRSCGGSWTRRRCPTCSDARRRRRCSRPPSADCASCSSSCRAATCASSRPPAAMPDAARDAGARRPRTAQRVRARRARRRAARPRSRGPALRRSSPRRGRSAIR